MDALEITRLILVAIHLISFAAIFGGWLATFKAPTVTKSQWWGSIGAVITGILLFGVAEMQGDPDRIKLTIKIALGVVIMIVAWMGRRKINRGESVSTGLAHGVGGTALITALIAVLWQ